MKDTSDKQAQLHDKQQKQHTLPLPFFGERSGSQANENLLLGMGEAISKRFKGVNKDVALVPEELQMNIDNVTKQFKDQTQKLSPMYMLDQGTKTQIKRTLKDNIVPLTKVALEAAMYCALFHHSKEGLRHVTRNKKRAGPIVSYVTNVMLPTPLFGPITGFVIRFAL